jgi:hypothetical protein
MAEEAAAEVLPERDPFVVLPPPLACKILALLPLDTRLRCAEVSPRWRAAVAERSLWTRLDFRGVARENAHDALLRCAAARAGRSLQALDASAAREGTLEAMNAVCASNAGAALTEVTLPVHQDSTLDELRSTLLAAPQLRSLSVHFLAVNSIAGLPVLLSALRNEAPFGALRLQRFWQNLALSDADELLSLADAAAAHASLTSVHLSGLSLEEPRALDALVNMAVGKRLESLGLTVCFLPPPPSGLASSLARLLSSAALTRLAVDNAFTLTNAPPLDAPGAVTLGAALRANTTLCWLSLGALGMWNDAEVVTTLLTALTAHPSIEEVGLNGVEGDWPELAVLSAADVAAIGASLRALLAADAPALRTLRMRDSKLPRGALAPLFEALPANTHLRELDAPCIDADCDFLRAQLLPALRANTSLRALHVSVMDAHGMPQQSGACAEAEALVAARAAAGAADGAGAQQ